MGPVWPLRDGTHTAPAWCAIRLARRRDAATLPDYAQNLAMARFEPLPEQHLRLRAALRGNQAATDQFYLATNGMVDPQPFFDDANIRRIIAAAASLSR
jgi:hypothetical protein